MTHQFFKENHLERFQQLQIPSLLLNSFHFNYGKNLNRKLKHITRTNYNAFLREDVLLLRYSRIVCNF